jgi:hypothetical protein
MRPRLWQTWLNLRIWLPFLLNRADRTRQVVYWSREYRQGLTWDIALPKQCWKTGATDGLERVKFTVSLRSFEYPLPLFGGTLVLVALILLIAWLVGWWMGLLVALLAAGGGFALLMIKSWRETVNVSLWSLPEHVDVLSRPDVVSDQDQLYVYVPTSALAEAALAEQKEERKRKTQDRGGFAPPPVHDEDRPSERKVDRPAGRRDDQGSERPASVYRPYSPPPAPDLPPIKLADDDGPPAR